MRYVMRSIISEDKFYKHQKLRDDRRRRYPYGLTEAHEMHAEAFLVKRVIKKVIVDELRNYYEFEND